MSGYNGFCDLMILKDDRIKNITRFVFLSIFLLTFITASSPTTASEAIQYYEINTELDEEGKSTVKLVITFSKPESSFQFNIIGRIQNFKVSSIAGPVNCTVKINGISSVDCKLNLTEEKRQVEINFETYDFVRTLENKFYFSGDYSLGKDVKRIFASLKLPKNALLVGENITTSRLSFPENASAFVAESGRIMITWNLRNIRKEDMLKLEVLYQQLQPPAWFQLRMRHFILFGAVFAIVFGFLIFRHFRRSEELVLSVLDEYERKVMNIIAEAGEIKQRKVVQLTNLSKAKVSRIVKRLAERGLIEVERIGRTNRLRLVKKKFRI